RRLLQSPCGDPDGAAAGPLRELSRPDLRQDGEAPLRPPASAARACGHDAALADLPMLRGRPLAAPGPSARASRSAGRPAGPDAACPRARVDVVGRKGRALDEALPGRGLAGGCNAR